MLLILATLVYAAFGIFASQAGGRIDAKLSSSILNGIGAVLPFALWQLQRMTTVSTLRPARAAAVLSLARVIASFTMGSSG